MEIAFPTPHFRLLSHFVKMLCCLSEGAAEQSVSAPLFPMEQIPPQPSCCILTEMAGLSSLSSFNNVATATLGETIRTKGSCLCMPDLLNNLIK